MKSITLLLLILLGYNAYAQKSIFVRVYDLKGKKINKGHVTMVTDTALQLRRKTESVDIPVRTIGFIKTKRSAGNNLLIGSLVGATTFAILGVVSAEPDDAFLDYSEAEGAEVGALFGLAFGAAIGGI